MREQIALDWIGDPDWIANALMLFAVTAACACPMLACPSYSNRLPLLGLPTPDAWMCMVCLACCLNLCRVNRPVSTFNIPSDPPVHYC